MAGFCEVGSYATAYTGRKEAGLGGGARGGAKEGVQNFRGRGGVIGRGHDWKRWSWLARGRGQPY